MSEGGKLSREDFTRRYAEGSGVSVEWIEKRMKALPCDCGEGTCSGWRMVITDCKHSVQSFDTYPAYYFCRLCHKPMVQVDGEWEET